MSLSALLLDLNPPQCRAVCHVHGPLLVLAGAGSGKTRVITRRIAYLLAAGHARPEEILAVTFTNKAADEMRERVAALVGAKQAARLEISTFHSFCLKVLRKHISQLGYRKNFTISSESDARTLLRRVVDDLGSKEAFSLASLQAQISLQKGLNTNIPLNPDASDQGTDTGGARNERRRVCPGPRLAYRTASQYSDRDSPTLDLSRVQSVVGDRDSPTLDSSRVQSVVRDRDSPPLDSSRVQSVGGDRDSPTLDRSRSDSPGGRSDSPGGRGDNPSEKYALHLPQVMEQYQSALQAANSLDFDDLLLKTLELWRQHPELLRDYQQRLRFLLVDEYQDTNRVQFELLRLLAGDAKNLCVVGDDDQSIYGWRGADVRHILDFKRHFPQAEVIALEQNYRSTTTILDAANHVIKHNLQRHEKKLWSELGKGRAIDWFLVGDEEAEAKEAVKWLKHIQQRAGARYSDFALLYRSNVQSKPLELAFRQEGIPYYVVGGQDFFERAEVKDVISYLKVLSNPRDEAALVRVINMPRRGIGDATLHQVHERCLREHISALQALENLSQDASVSKSVQQGIEHFLTLVRRFRKRLRDKEGTLKTIVEDLIAAIDYHGELRRVAKNPEQALSRWRNVESVIATVAEYENNASTPSLAQFLDQTHLNSDQDRMSRQGRREEGVALMTIHSAKGLEFPFVFLMGVEEGLLPHGRSLADNALEEERRLFYVAITRAQRHLTFFEAISRSRNGKSRMSSTSRFLKEIPESLLRQQIRAVREMVQERVAPDNPAPKEKKRRPSRRRV